MPSPEVSVIISTYNNTQALRLGMAGWNAQTFKDFEIIIADDGSSAEQVAEINRIIADYTPSSSSNTPPFLMKGFKSAKPSIMPFV